MMLEVSLASRLTLRLLTLLWWLSTLPASPQDDKHRDAQLSWRQNAEALTFGA